jgi:hypothetical protein
MGAGCDTKRHEVAVSQQMEGPDTKKLEDRKVKDQYQCIISKKNHFLKTMTTLMKKPCLYLNLIKHYVNLYNKFHEHVAAVNFRSNLHLLSQRR